MALPDRFHVFRPAKSSSWSKTKIYHLGSPDVQPLFTCNEAVSWTGKNSTDLYTEAADDGTPVASIASGSMHKNNATITIAASSPSGNDESKEISEPFRRHVSLTHETWEFVASLRSGSELYAEKFEWRRSSGDELASLRSGKKTYGWKLVRLHTTEAANPDVSSERREVGESSDGKEIVAVWSDDTQTWFRGDEKGVVGKFEFLGSGRGGSGLGDQWRFFAAMSALHIRQINLQQAQAASTTTTAAAVAAT